MANINVNRNVTDTFYRYKMPKLIAKVEGKGNGIKTVIVNMTEVAKALSRPPTYPTKFFGCELGAQTQFDLKNERYIVNGSHDSDKLQDLLDGFILKFVLCPECENPETNLAVSAKKGLINQRCIACGYQGLVDMTHKLTTFILKNPPNQDPAATPNKKDKKGKRGKCKENGEEPGSPEPEEGGGDTVDGPQVISQKDSYEEDWGEDTSEAAVQERMQALTEAAKTLTVTADLEKTPQERIDMFYEYVKGKKEADSLTGADREIAAEADRLEVKDKGPLILVELLFSDKILTEIKQYRKHFLRFTSGNDKAQKYLLGGLEQLIGNVHQEKLLPKTAHILKAFYDNDILDEEILIDWDKKISKKFVSKEIAKEIHSKAKPFITWLQEAEEESEEEEEEVEVVYSSTEKAGTIEKVAPPKQATPEKEEDDDFNIDDI